MVAAFRSALARPDRRAEIMRRLTAAKVAPEPAILAWTLREALTGLGEAS